MRKTKFLPYRRALNNKQITFELLLALLSCLTIDGTSISKTVSKSITSISSISKTGISISESSISQTSTIAISSIVKTSISISLWLSISRPLAIVAKTSIAETAIAKSITTISSISKTRISISKSSISKTSTIAIGSIEKTSISFSLRLSLSLTLGNMDNSSRVGNIPTSSSISSSKSWESGRGNSSNSYSVGNIGDAVSGSNWGSKSISIAKTSIAKPSTIAKTSISQTSSVPITSIKESSIGLSLSSGKSSTANHKSNLDHVHPVTVKLRIPC